MKKITSILLLLVFLGSSNTSFGQSGITIDATQFYATLKFKDSQGNKLDGEYSGILSGAYGIGYRYVSDGGFLLGTTVGLRKMGATMVYDDINYSWNLHYVNLKLGVGYELKLKSICPYLLVSGYGAYLLKGYQSINNENFNIKLSKSLKEYDYGIYITPGVQFKLMDNFSAHIELGYLLGLNNLEKDDGQKSYNLGYCATIGFSYSFTK
jgi:hypothetical protein